MPPAVDSIVQTVLVAVVPALALLAVLLRTHRSVGEAVVRIRPQGQVRRRAVILRWILGTGGYLLLGAWSGGLASTLAVVSVVAVFLTRSHRGLAYRLLGWEIVDDRTRAGRDIRLGR